ncbi:hypothetical protein V8F06_012054 [Rhypophila decipiens]
MTTVLCEICNFESANREILITHWQEEERKGNGHFHCTLCVKVFRSYGGWDIHRRNFHAAKQNLTCPGCHDTFSRVGGLIDHIEKDACKGIKNVQLDARREEKLAFARELQRRHYGLDPDADDDKAASIIAESVCTSDKGPANFSKYLSKIETGVSHLGLSAIRPGAEDTMRPNPLLFRKQERDFPELPSQKQQAVPTEPPEAIQQPATFTQTVWEDWDPNNPRFRAQNHYNKFTGSYKCPHPRCPKSFGSGNALVTHISAAHRKNAIRVECPTCLRKFDSITALTQHAESQANKCNVRETDEYRQFMDQLSGGIVDTAEKHADGTNKYTVPEDAVRAFGPQQLWERAQKAKQDRLERELERLKNYVPENVNWD